jgi:hypothetical protein
MHNAIKKLLVDVSDQDIANGDACNCNSCPLALAILRMNPGCRVQVLVGTITLTEASGKVWKAVTPRTAGRFMARFDAARKVASFRFKVMFVTV